MRSRHPAAFNRDRDIAYRLVPGVKGSLRRSAPLTPATSQITSESTHTEFKRG